MEPVKAYVTSLTLPTYPEGRTEEMPMFAENRIHQRTSGDPYPQKVVLTARRDKKEEKAYTCIVLENRFLRLEILPELGGRIYSAKDKLTGYNFFYKQHVVKPALIGCLGSWISGGVEFNWPFHHRASTFLPVDYAIEQKEDGSAIVWLSENEPMSRMKGMVGVVLRPDEAIFETRMRLYNRTPHKQSFLWWENAAVPVNEKYRIFFPSDVSYVNFHYKRSVTTFPIANNALGVYNGIRYDGDVDISYHKNTRQPTSYFSAPSDYDYFGGYDEGKGCGVIHVADHTISPGKKMFTWAYNQLSQTWEKALTDADGAYAELMAGSYSDNQPDFAWIEPYEEKAFSQYWYPFAAPTLPLFANTRGMLYADGDSTVLIPTKSASCAHITVTDADGSTLYDAACELAAREAVTIPASLAEGCTILVAAGPRKLMQYTVRRPDDSTIPETTKDLPDMAKERSAEELYLCGVHVFQYRDPATRPDAYWKEAIRREPDHVPSLIALADDCCRRFFYDEAKTYIDRALEAALRHNKHPESGKLFYTLGLIELARGKRYAARKAFENSMWNADTKAAALTHLAALKGETGDYEQMIAYAEEALISASHHSLAEVYRALGFYRLGETETALAALREVLSRDPLYHLAAVCERLIAGEPLMPLAKTWYSDPAQTALDIYFDLAACGSIDMARRVLSETGVRSPIVSYLLGDEKAGEETPLGSAFPSRPGEYALLRDLAARDGLPMAHYTFGCMQYANGHYEEAYALFERSAAEKPGFYINYRNMAALLYSHLHGKERVLPLLEKANALCPCDPQLLYETLYVRNRLCADKAESIKYVLERTAEPTDMLVVELAKSHLLAGQPEKALELLASHDFVACEGGEHAIADPYMLSHFALGRAAYENGDYMAALSHFRTAQTLPDRLGSGLWNECRTVPYRYYEALCLEKLGKTAEADAHFSFILSLRIDYFSDMHLPQLPYYQAKILKRRGRYGDARALMDACEKKWKAAMNAAIPGYFGTTPFFLSYIEEPKTAAQAKYTALLAYVERFRENTDAAKTAFEKALSLDGSDLTAFLEARYGVDD